MISYKILDGATRDEIISALRLNTPTADIDYAEEILELHIEHAEENPDIEYAVCSSHGCLLIRKYDAEDGEYSFCYPIALLDGADATTAITEIRAYAVKEEIPLVIYDLPAEELGNTVGCFRHMNIDAVDPMGELYTLRVMSEAALLDGIPSADGELGISLGPITEEDAAEYTRLCTDADTNAMWGYDYSADEPDPSPSYFREMADAELCRGVALCLAVRQDGRFIGEAVLYYFDLSGGCECAVRLLCEYRGRGFATEALRCLRNIARDMGIIRLCASVDANNAPSIAMTAKVLPELYRDEKIVRFLAEL